MRMVHGQISCTVSSFVVAHCYCTTGGQRGQHWRLPTMRKRTREEDRARKNAQRRRLGKPIRRIGSDALSPRLRSLKLRLVAAKYVQQKLRPTPVRPVVLDTGKGVEQFRKRRLQAFGSWLANTKQRKPGLVDITKDPGVLASLKAVEGVPQHRKLQVLLRYWRIDNVATWNKLQTELKRPTPAWIRVEGDLRGMAHPFATEHRSFYSQDMKGLTAAEQHVIFMKQWRVAKLDPIVRLQGRPALVDVLRQIRRLPAIASYSCVCGKLSRVAERCELPRCCRHWPWG